MGNSGSSERRHHNVNIVNCISGSETAIYFSDDRVKNLRVNVTLKNCTAADNAKYAHSGQSA